MMQNSENIANSRNSNNCRRKTKDMHSLYSSVDNRFLDGEFSLSKKRSNSCDQGRTADGACINNNKKGVMIKKPVGILMAGGARSEDHQSHVTNKNIHNDNGSLSSVTCVSHGSISVIGRRRAMEDAVSTVVPGLIVGDPFDVYDFFAVYDGHGGARVANACRDRLHQLVAREVRFSGERGLCFWEKIMVECFKKMDDEVSGGERRGVEGGEERDLSPEKTVGSTAVVVMVGKEELVVANCGDSRAVLCRDGVAVALSCDHKPDRPDERQRVEAAGGKVINWNGSRVLGVLGTSRSIGDQYLKPYVTAEPEVKVIKQTESDDFIVMGSDGLWDVISNEFACEVVKKCFGGQTKHRRFLDEFSGSSAAEAAALLAELAMAKGSKDNISVVVIELKNSK